MYISYVKIRNFRNFHLMEVDLSQNVVIIGENTSGKSNFLDAIRLVLDPSLSDRDRKLVREDFWAGDVKSTPPFKGTVIEIIVGLTDLDETLLSFLHDSTTPHNPTDIAYLAYRFEPKHGLDIEIIENSTSSHYEFNFYRPRSEPLFEDSESTGEWSSKYKFIDNMREIRKRLVFQVIPALRDIENSIESWRHSPLRNLVERLRLEEDPKFKQAVSRLGQATEILREADPIERLEIDLKRRLERMLGGIHEIDPRLNFIPLNESVLSRSLRLFTDGEDWRPVASASLGIANILHLALLTLESEKRRSDDNEFVILGVEEPEAHLHPHLQRLVFRDYFELSKKLAQPTLVTTHSPHITSVAPLDSFVLIKTDGIESNVSSTANSLTDLSPKEKNDLTRYLDATRSEMLFAKGVILVEGPTELFLLPIFVEGMKFLNSKTPSEITTKSNLLVSSPNSLDQFSITICDIHGTGFKPYVKLLKALNIPVVVLTDGDRFKKPEGGYEYPGLQRGISIVECFAPDKTAKQFQKLYSHGKIDQLRKNLAGFGIFVNEQTMEAELLLSNNKSSFLESFVELGAGIQLQANLKDWIDLFVQEGGMGDEADSALVEILKRIEHYPCYGKGRFAQELAERLEHSKIPSCFSEAVQYLVNEIT